MKENAGAKSEHAHGHCVDPFVFPFLAQKFAGLAPSENLEHGKGSSSSSCSPSSPKNLELGTRDDDEDTSSVHIRDNGRAGLEQER